MNYEHRREQLRDWNLPETDWTYLRNRTRITDPRYDTPLDKAVAGAFVYRVRPAHEAAEYFAAGRARYRCRLRYWVREFR
ncbi:hypothetical protein ACIPSJ_44205 [Streptomyces sp. NPDC090088]|uniref:hypothetical protein n=1 Tax=Streptomyces sp. NPDC090088 TaxID=3365944 RepID=UPI00380F1443